MNCDEVEPVLTPYVDGEAPPGDREKVSEHLSRCRPCAARAAGEAAAKRLVQLRARVLTPPPPRELRARCALLARGSGPRRVAWLSWKPLGLAVTTAIVVVVAGFVGAGVLSRSDSLLVAGLTLDHLKCFALSGGAAAGNADAGTLQANLRREYGWQIAVPPGALGEGLRLVGARRCLSTDGTVAHILYRHGGKPLSLFVLPSTAHAAASMSIAGYASRVWSKGAATYVLVASESEAGMQPVAKYFERY